MLSRSLSDYKVIVSKGTVDSKLKFGVSLAKPSSLSKNSKKSLMHVASDHQIGLQKKNAIQSMTGFYFYCYRCTWRPIIRSDYKKRCIFRKVSADTSQQPSEGDKDAFFFSQAESEYGEAATS